MICRTASPRRLTMHARSPWDSLLSAHSGCRSYSLKTIVSAFVNLSNHLEVEFLRALYKEAQKTGVQGRK